MMPDRTKAPEIKPFGHLSIPPENVERLSNGLTLHSYRGGDQPVCRISVMIPFDAGSESNPAVLRMLPQMLTEGCAAYTADQLDEFFDFKGVRIGGRTSAHFHILEAGFLADSGSDVIDILGAILSAPSFDKQRLETIRQRNIASYLTSRRQPLTLAGEELTRRIYGADHLLARRVDQDSFRSVDTQQLAAAYARVMNPANIHVFISGLFSDALLETARRVFGALGALSAGETFRIQPYRTENTPQHITVEASESLQSAVAIGIPAVRRDNPHYVPLRIAVMALGGYFGSRLMSNIREDKGLTYNISASLLGDYEGAYTFIGALCDKSYTDRVVNEIQNELKALATDPPEGDELERLRLNAMTDLAEILDNPTNIMGYYSSGILVGSPGNYFELQQAAIQNLTSETIAEMAKRYLLPSQTITVTTL